MVYAKFGSVLENDTHKILQDCEIQTNHLISARRPEIVIVNKKKKENLPICGLCHPGRPQSKTKRKQKEREISRPCWRTKKDVRNMKVTVIPIAIGALRTISKGLINT